MTSGSSAPTNHCKPMFAENTLDHAAVCAVASRSFGGRQIQPATSVVVSTTRYVGKIRRTRFE